jgi:two-component system OmpR family response regulator
VARILILDDDVEIRTLMVLILEREGYQLAYTDNSQESVKLLGNASFNLLIMDGALLDTDWWGFYSSIKTDSDLCNIAIIVLLPKFMLTEEGVNQFFFQEVQYNKDGLLTSPWRKEDLVETVKKVLGNYGTALPIVDR